MSIEAMKLVIGAFDSLSPDHPARHTVLHINALRTAIQQAEAQQPDTGEPVLFTHPDTFAMNNAHVGAWKPGHELTGYIPLYTHQAPSVPMTERELELIDGMIAVQLDHAQRCDAIDNLVMGEKQKGWDMERVELLRRIRSFGITAQEGTNGEIN